MTAAKIPLTSNTRTFNLTSIMIILPTFLPLVFVIYHQELHQFSLLRLLLFSRSETSFVSIWYRLNHYQYCYKSKIIEKILLDLGSSEARSKNGCMKSSLEANLGCFLFVSLTLHLVVLMLTLLWRKFDKIYNNSNKSMEKRCATFDCNV